MKIDTPEYHSLFTPELKRLSELFIARGFELRIAGGAVRDILSGIQPTDVDFATTATPEQMKAMFTEEEIRMLNMRGESHGTITVRINDKENFEITTLRIDVATDGRRAQVEFTTDWHLDANRRDLTINSMFLGLDGTLYDYFNGLEDLKNKKVRFVGEPVQRIREDYLRILRYFRFFGRIAENWNDYDEQTLQDIKENANGLSGISGERIWVELKKILLGRFNYSILKTMIKLGISPHIGLPDNPSTKELDDLQERAINVNPQPVTILAALIKNDSQMMELNTRLKFSGYERDLGFFLIAHRGEKPCSDPLQPYQTLVLETNNKQSDVLEWVEEVLKYRGEVKLLGQMKDWKIPKFPVSGYTLVSQGISGGRRFNHILTALKKRWINSGFTMTEEKLLEQLEEIIHEVDLQYPSHQKEKKKIGKKMSR